MKKFNVAIFCFLLIILSNTLFSAETITNSYKKEYRPQNDEIVASQTTITWGWVVGTEHYLLTLYDENKNTIATYKVKGTHYEFKAPNYIPSNARYWSIASYIPNFAKHLKGNNDGYISKETFSFHVSDSIQIEGNGTKESPYLIYTTEHLKIINDSFTYKANSIPETPIYFKQMMNITLSDTDKAIIGGLDTINDNEEIDLNYIAKNGRFFSGVYNGNNHSIYITINSDKDFVGLFGLLSNATILNLKINGKINGNNCVGSLAGLCLNSCEISHCESNTIKTEGNSYVGGLVGYLGENSVINNSSNHINSLFAKNKYLGGIAGYCDSYSRIDKCSNFGKQQKYVEPEQEEVYNEFLHSYVKQAKEIYRQPEKTCYVGGIAGYAKNCCKFMDCKNDPFSCSTFFNEHIGGIVGKCENECYFDNCKNQAEIKGYNKIGGIAGSCGTQTTIASCTANGSIEIDIDSFSNAKEPIILGGIVAIISENSKIRNCRSSTSFSSKKQIFNGTIGGIVGESMHTKLSKDFENNIKELSSLSLKNDNVEITDCYNYYGLGESGLNPNYFGGIVGVGLTPLKILNCENKARINLKSGFSAGGIIAKAYFETEIERCENITKDLLKSKNIVGGIIGNIDVNCQFPCSISYCKNKSDIKSNGACGGIVGVSDSKKGINVSYCLNSGKVIGDASVGGIVGFCQNSKILKVKNKGHIDGRTFIGGIIGESINNIIAKDSENTGFITSNQQMGYAGAAIGCDDGNTKISIFKNSGNIITKKRKNQYKQNFFGFGEFKANTTEHVGVILSEEQKKEEKEKNDY